MAELFGSIVTQPVEYEFSSSNKGIHVVPEFRVFQTPPEPTATYQIFSLFESIAISAILPERKAGPIFLKLKSLSENLLYALEPWCGNIYCGVGVDLRQNYKTLNST